MKRHLGRPGRHSGSAIDGQPVSSVVSPASLQTMWDTHWFSPETEHDLFITRRIVYFATAIWFLIQLSALSYWWSESGFVATKFASALEGYSEGAFPVRFRVSPLWMTQSKLIVAAWSVAGAILAILSAFNWGGRILRATTALWTLALVQRMSWSGGLVEPYLVALTAYLAIARAHGGEDWSHCFAKKLIQMHTWLLLCAALVSQLALATWRQGEAAWWLAASGRSNVLSTSMLEDRLLVVNFLTHGLTLSTIVAIGCLWPLAGHPSLTRSRIGVASGLTVALGYAVPGDQILYGALLFAGVMTWSGDAHFLRLFILLLVTPQKRR